MYLALARVAFLPNSRNRARCRIGLKPQEEAEIATDPVHAVFVTASMALEIIGGQRIFKLQVKPYFVGGQVLAT